MPLRNKSDVNTANNVCWIRSAISAISDLLGIPSGNRLTAFGAALASMVRTSSSTLHVLLCRCDGSLSHKLVPRPISLTDRAFISLLHAEEIAHTNIVKSARTVAVAASLALQ